MNITINGTKFDVHPDATIINLKTGNHIKGSPNNAGYVQIYAGGHRILRSHIIAKAFIPNPNNYTEVNHIDGDTTNDAADNLEWCSHSDNQKRKIKGGKLRKILTLVKFLKPSEIQLLKEYIELL